MNEAIMLSREALPAVSDRSISVMPYGFMGKDDRALVAFYTLLQQEKALLSLFWAEGGAEISFETFRAFCQNTTMFLLANKDANQLVGAYWLSRIIPRQSAHVDVWYARGTPLWQTRQWSQEMIQWGFREDTLGLDRVWCLTPWRHAVRHAQGIGGILHQVIPDYAWIRAAWRTVYLLCFLAGRQIAIGTMGNSLIQMGGQDAGS